MNAATRILQLWRELTPVERESVFAAIALEPTFPDAVRHAAAESAGRFRTRTERTVQTPIGAFTVPSVAGHEVEAAAPNVDPTENRRRLWRVLHRAYYAPGKENGYLFNADERREIGATISNLQVIESTLSIFVGNLNPAYVCEVTETAERLAAEYQSRINNRS